MQLHAQLAQAKNASPGQQVVYPIAGRSQGIYEVVTADKDGIVARSVKFTELREYLIATPDTPIGIIVQFQSHPSWSSTSTGTSSNNFYR